MATNVLTPLVDANLAIEKLRVRTQIRQTHLAKSGRTDPETDWLLERLNTLEKDMDKRVAVHIKAHPAYPWFSQVKGVGKENISKVVAPLRIQPDSENPDKPYANHVSGFWSYAGYSVVHSCGACGSSLNGNSVCPQCESGEAVVGRSQRLVRGEKTTYNTQLRMMCWRLGGALLKAKGRFYGVYLQEKDLYTQRFLNRGFKIVPASQLPKDAKGKKREEQKYVSEGHIHNMAMRKMIKLFLACLFMVWREAEGLPTASPYVIEKLGHKGLIEPWSMVDKPTKRKA